MGAQLEVVRLLRNKNIENTGSWDIDAFVDSCAFIIRPIVNNTAAVVADLRLKDPWPGQWWNRNRNPTDEDKLDGLKSLKEILDLNNNILWCTFSNTNIFGIEEFIPYGKSRSIIKSNYSRLVESIERKQTSLSPPPPPDSASVRDQIVKLVALINYQFPLYRHNGVLKEEGYRHCTRDALKYAQGLTDKAPLLGCYICQLYIQNALPSLPCVRGFFPGQYHEFDCLRLPNLKSKVESWQAAFKRLVLLYNPDWAIIEGLISTLEAVGTTRYFDKDGKEGNNGWLNFVEKNKELSAKDLPVWIEYKNDQIDKARYIHIGARLKKNFSNSCRTSGSLITNAWMNRYVALPDDMGNLGKVLADNFSKGTNNNLIMRVSSEELESETLLIIGVSIWYWQQPDDLNEATVRLRLNNTSPLMSIASELFKSYAAAMVMVGKSFDNEIIIAGDGITKDSASLFAKMLVEMKLGDDLAGTDGQPSQVIIPRLSTFDASCIRTPDLVVAFALPTTVIPEETTQFCIELVTQAEMEGRLYANTNC